MRVQFRATFLYVGLLFCMVIVIIVILFLFKDSYYCVLIFVSVFLADELGDFAGELKLSLFQLGVGPQIMASIIMQVSCFLLSSHVYINKGIDNLFNFYLLTERK